VTSTAQNSSRPQESAAQEPAEQPTVPSPSDMSSEAQKMEAKKTDKPIAIRLLVSSPHVSWWRSRWFKRPLKGLALGLVGLVTLGLVLAYHAITQPSEQFIQHPVSAAFTQVLPLSKKIQQLATYRSLVKRDPSTSTSDTPESDSSQSEEATESENPSLSRYGHHLYPEADPAQLMVVGSYSQDLEQRFERLRPEAGLALLRMIDAARLDGVWIVPVSGFRDTGRQNMLFQLQTQRQGSAEEAAKSVAPPGFSEHHTGYVIDLADGLARARDISLKFGETDAFKWLTRYAHEFGFELSFPLNNPQGVAYEPWHWRYVGSPEARGVFEQARQNSGS
jgi:zinc D-Ala-D-Ala carboxypeptidase